MPHPHDDYTRELCKIADELSSGLSQQLNATANLVSYATMYAERQLKRKKHPKYLREIKKQARNLDESRKRLSDTSQRLHSHIESYNFKYPGFTQIDELIILRTVDALKNLLKKAQAKPIINNHDE